MKEINVSGFLFMVDDEDFERVSAITWFIDKTNIKENLFYACHGASKEKMRLHRFVMGCTFKDGTEVDHINGNTLDNRKSNLRVCKHRQNGKNMRRSKKNTSGYKGVTWHSRDKVFQARIGVDMKRIHLGYFDTAEAAHSAYCEASKKYHGEFGRTN